MKTTTTRIIEGKRYNTATATKVAHYWNGRGAGDFHNVNETLYLTKKGTWFLVGQGGALSSYAESYGNGTCGGEQWIVFEPDQAFEWLERRGETEALEQYFSDKIEEA